MGSDRVHRRVRRPRTGAGGFVLAITLWILAAIAVAVAGMSLWSLEQVRQSRVGHERLQEELGMLATRDTLLYLMSTRAVTVAGLPSRTLTGEERSRRHLDEMGALDNSPIGGELRLDGTLYQGLQGARFDLQDEAGLFPVVLPDEMRLERFLVRQGVEAGEVAHLRDTFLDYVDADELTRLNGAERREYERDKRLPPPNRRLLSPIEISRPMGWERLPSALLADLAERITPFYSGAVNLNTVPPELMPFWIPGCPATCERLLQMRGQAPFRSFMELETRLGVALPGDMVDYRFMADDTLRLTLWGRTGAGVRLHVRLTPLADQRGPWSILAAYPLARPASDEPADETGCALLSDAESDRL